MATSFQGWGSSWGSSWGGASDPNAMYGSVTMVFIGTGTLTGASTGSKVRRWSGTIWVEHDLRYWNGLSWIVGQLKHWNGSTWV